MTYEGILPTQAPPTDRVHYMQVLAALDGVYVQRGDSIQYLEGKDQVREVLSPHLEEGRVVYSGTITRLGGHECISTVTINLTQSGQSDVGLEELL